MKKFIFISVIIFLAIKYVRAFRSPSNHKLPQSSDIAMVDSCTGKKMCAVIYVAPWCPACETMMPSVLMMAKNAEKNKEYGFQVIVGAGREAGDNARKAELIGYGTLTDDDFKIGKSLGVTYFPSLFVLKSDRTVFIRDQEAMNWMNQNFSNSNQQ
jgi:thiol-disulfide isomerase/thioredoxin